MDLLQGHIYIPALTENPRDARLRASFASLALAKSSMARSEKNAGQLLFGNIVWCTHCGD